jgi:hypothetical protein
MVQYETPQKELLDKRLAEADKEGEHLWIVTACWKVADPEKHRGEAMHLDRENILQIAGPGCFKCEQPYSRRIAAKPCYGSTSELQ